MFRKAFEYFVLTPMVILSGAVLISAFFFAPIVYGASALVKWMVDYQGPVHVDEDDHAHGDVPHIDRWP